MELRAIMELGGGRGESTGKKGTPYIVWEKDPTVTHQPARGQRYYRAWPAVLPQGRAVLLLATKRYYRTAVRYYRTDPRYCRDPSTETDAQKLGAVLPHARYYRAPHAVLPQGKSPSQGGRETSVPTSAKKRK